MVKEEFNNKERIKINIAKEFISKHRCNNIYHWRAVQDDTQEYLSIYEDMVKGFFGQSNTDSLGHYNITISKDVSASGETEWFLWSDCKTTTI